MWQPDPAWTALPGGMGPSTVGVWSAVEGGREVVVKRLEAPAAHDPAELSHPRHFAYWRRASDVALSGIVVDTPGLRAAGLVRAEEDAEGITLVQELVRPTPSNGLFVARALGRFGGVALPPEPWLARSQLRDRIARVARRGGWTTLSRTPVADLAHRLWERREVLLAELDALPQVSQHGDPVPANLPGCLGDDLVAIDWSTLGSGAVGADVGYFALSAKEEFDTLIDAYVDGLPPGLATVDQARSGAQITAVYTVLSRADWALARIAGGEGALAGKFRHPSVAPYLRAMQRQFPQISALL
ncbi:MAG: phosphotransferase [Nocardioides sp.]